MNKAVIQNQYNNKVYLIDYEDLKKKVNQVDILFVGDEKDSQLFYDLYLKGIDNKQKELDKWIEKLYKNKPENYEDSILRNIYDFMEHALRLWVFDKIAYDSKNSNYSKAQEALNYNYKDNLLSNEANFIYQHIEEFQPIMNKIKRTNVSYEKILNNLIKIINEESFIKKYLDERDRDGFVIYTSRNYKPFKTHYIKYDLDFYD